MRGFQLREEAAGAARAQNSSEGDTALVVDQVCAMFDALDAGLVRDVLEQTRDTEEAVAILSSIMHDNDHDDHDDHDDRGDHEASASDSVDYITSMWDDVVPLDCKRIIWGMLSSKDMARAAGTSREWAQFAEEMRTWRTFLVVQRSLKPLAVEGLVRSHDQAEKIKIDYRKASSSTATDAGLFYRQIRRGQEARLDAFEEDENNENDENDGNDGDSLPRHRQLLRRQPPKVCRDVLVNSSDACRFDKYELESLLDALEYIERLSIVDSSSIDDEAVRFLLGYRPAHHPNEQERQELSLSLSLSLLNTRLSNTGLKELVLNGRWSTLDVSRNRRLTELVSPPARCPLRALTAKSLPNLTKINLSLGGTRVGTLDLSENHQLGECIITATDSFRELNLSGCKNLRMLMLDCPSLETLIAARCRRLQLVGGYVNGLNIPRLVTLNVNACRDVSDEGLNLLVDKLRHLRHLNVGGCIRLTRLNVDFRQAPGCTLDAYGCGRLGHVEIRGSSGLVKLVTAGCGGADGVRVIKL